MICVLNQKENTMTYPLPITLEQEEERQWTDSDIDLPARIMTQILQFLYYTVVDNPTEADWIKIFQPIINAVGQILISNRESSALLGAYLRKDITNSEDNVSL